MSSSGLIEAALLEAMHTGDWSTYWRLQTLPQAGAAHDQN